MLNPKEKFFKCCEEVRKELGQKFDNGTLTDWAARHYGFTEEEIAKRANETEQK